MILYVDASALVKVYVTEAGTAQVRQWMEEAESVWVAKVAYAEVVTTFKRKHTAREMDEATLAERIGAFEQDWRQIMVMDLSDPVLSWLRDTRNAVGLRTLDAIHLASAVLLRTHLEQELTFLCSDRRLGEAAKAERLRVLAPVQER